jgi:hypothetical protein
MGGAETAGSSAANGEAAEESDHPQADPLVGNGLGSPTCKGALASGLSMADRRNCETSGFVAASAPTGDYGIDVHIDTGFLGISSNIASSMVQDIVVGPLWTALVWAVHALLVMIEWCFALDLLRSSATLGLGGGLRRMQASFTEPWMPIALACTAALVAYHGIVRRRVAHTLGEALLTIVMIVAGMWLIVDPTGTVGALGEWADQASLGTLAVAARGTPTAPQRQLTNSLSGLFTAAIEGPWCFLEFGEVAWCRETARLDPRLHSAALAIAAKDATGQSCVPSGLGATDACIRIEGAAAKALQRAAELLRRARTNGAIFLALPANGPARNSINEPGSLLQALCQSSDATSCHGPTAAQAEFRTDSGTLTRLGGLALIAGGLLGMLLLLGFIGVRLLVAAAFSLLYLLLAPAIVLAPAFGEGGRTLFRRWASRLLGAVVSKLVFSFLLGVVLAVLGILSSLDGLGWWMQWLLMSAFWWGAFTRRHEVLGIAGAALGDRGVYRLERPMSRRLGDAMRTSHRVASVAHRAWERRLGKKAPRVDPRERAEVGRSIARARADEQVERALEHEMREARERSSAAAETHHGITGHSVRLKRLERERAGALAAGESGRAAKLAQRQARLEGEIQRRRDELAAAQRLVRDGEDSHRRTGEAITPQRREAWRRFLDAQAALPGRGGADVAGRRRDYAALAGLAGYGRGDYERMDSRGQRSARLEIDRQLALREELSHAVGALTADAATPSLSHREHRRVERGLDDALRRRMRSRGAGMPEQRTLHAELDRWRRDGRAARSGSSVMHDAHEVAARRKRQLGSHGP